MSDVALPGARGRELPPLHPRPFVGVSQKSIFKRPCQVLAMNTHKNGSKNGLRAPRTGMGCPHIGPFVGVP